VRWVILLPLLVAGCGGSAPDASPPIDETLQRETHAGRLAFELERDEEAISRFRAALARAHERDDLDTIADNGYNLAVAELRANAPDRALADARATRMELERRGAKPFPSLQLAEATALYRTGGVAEADRMAQVVQQREDAEAAARATFLRGLIADDRGDAIGLERALSAIAATPGPEYQADAAELAARLALQRGEIIRARVEAERAADLRRNLLDYHSMARSLAFAAHASELAGDTQTAADLYCRAGRSAAAQNDRDSAKHWLRQAIALSRDPALTQAARSALTAVEGQH
jgi:hypothetical protein